MRLLRRVGDSLARIRREQRGNVAIIFAASMTVMMALAAISVDVGRAYVQRQRFKIVVDAAAFAGAAKLPDQTSATNEATHVLQANNLDPAQASVTFSPDGTWVYVSTRANVSTSFARVLGITQLSIPATTGAHSASPNNLPGIVPIGVPNQTFVYGQLVTLKAGARGQQMGPGNFGALALGGNGASTYRDNFTNGYSGIVSRGDSVATQPGNMDGPTFDACTSRVLAQPEPPRIENQPCSVQNFQGPQQGQNTCNNNPSPTGSLSVVFLPVVDYTDPRGRGTVTVLGFAAFHLEGCNGGQVTGRFIRTTTEAAQDSGGQDFGLHSVKLGA